VKDARDFLVAGFTYDDLCRCCTDWMPPQDTTKQNDQTDVPQAENALEHEICRAMQIDVLGRLEDGSIKVFSLFHRRSCVMPRPDKVTYEMFCQICGPPAKACLLKSRVDDDVPGMWGCDQARSAINMLAGYRTLSDEIELGVGCWLATEDQDDVAVDEAHEHPRPIIIVGANEAAIYNGSLSRVEHPRAAGSLLDFSTSHKPWYQFPQLQRNIEQSSDHEFRMTAYRNAYCIFDRWKWGNQASSVPLAIGLVLATWIQHIWNWRPQVAIIGPSKSGKSFLCDFLDRMFSPNSILASDTTAAGLRQQILNSMPAVIVDEADPKDKAQQAERKKILGMIRQASRGGLVLRGTSGQRSTQHTLRHLCWIFGIQLPFDDEADRNRIIMLELKLPEKEDEGKLAIPSRRDCRELGQRLLGVAVWAATRSRALAKGIREEKVPGIDSRIIESYAVPTAILAVTFGFGDDSKKTKELLTDLLAGVAEDQPQPLYDDLMQEILSARVKVGIDNPTIGQCLERIVSLSTGAGEAEIALAGCGMKLRRGEGSQSLVLQYKPAVKHLLRGTRWEGTAIDQILRTMPGAERCNSKIGGVTARGIEIPWEVVVRRYLGDEPHESRTWF
jgi:hypothetical protein